MCQIRELIKNNIVLFKMKLSFYRAKKESKCSESFQNSASFGCLLVNEVEIDYTPKNSVGARLSHLDRNGDRIGSTSPSESYEEISRI